MLIVVSKFVVPELDKVAIVSIPLPPTYKVKGELPDDPKPVAEPYILTAIGF